MANRRLAWVNLPNLLTLLRLLMVPVVVYYIVAGRYLLAGWLFGAAAFTDILDGLAARGMAVSTQVGAYFDPIADKCLLSGVYLALGIFTFCWGWAFSCYLRRFAASRRAFGERYRPLSRFVRLFCGSRTLFSKLVYWLNSRLQCYGPAWVLRFGAASTTRGRASTSIGNIDATLARE
jgi:phosphatidylglycerophosphate synthase